MEFRLPVKALALSARRPFGLDNISWGGGRVGVAHPNLLQFDMGVMSLGTQYFYHAINGQPLIGKFAVQCAAYESFSDVGEIRVYFASKILTPCRMH